MSNYKNIDSDISPWNWDEKITNIGKKEKWRLKVIAILKKYDFPNKPINLHGLICLCDLLLDSDAPDCTDEYFWTYLMKLSEVSTSLN